MTEWFENEAFWKELYPLLFPEKAFDAAEGEVEKIIALLGFEGRTILDLACGPGRHSIAFARKGYRVTGVDRTAFYLEKARSLSSASGVEVEWVEEDMREFVRPDAYDLAISYYTSFGYFEDKDDDLRVLRNIHGNLRKGGVCLLELVGKEWVSRELQPATVHDLEDGRIVFERHVVVDGWSRIRNDWFLIDGDRVKSFRFTHTVYSGQEIRDRLDRSGFTGIRLFGDLEGNEYGPKARRLVAVARRP